MGNVDISPARAMHYVTSYFPQTPSISYPDGDLTAAQIGELVERWAAWLTERGVGEGDRVAYLGFNSPTLLVLHLACAHLKAVYSPLNFRLAKAEYEHIFSDATPACVVVEPRYVPMVESLADTFRAAHQVVVDIDPADPLTAPADGYTPLSEVYSGTAAAPERAVCHEDDLAALIYTSGTTGKAKGVRLTHGNLWWNHVNVDSVVETKRTDVTHAAAPLFHIGGLNALVLRTLIRGGSVIVRRSFDPAQALADILHHQVNTLFGVPAMFAAMSRVPGFAEADLSCVRSAIVAGAPVPPALIEKYLQHGMDLQQAWGLTETSPFATYLPAEQTSTRLGSAGIPMPYTEVRLADLAGDGDVEEVNVRGEMCVRGPNVTSGYWNNPAATAAAIDADGWFHTGDIGYRDDDGYYYIVDRLKDMIITGGENVYPAEVEHAIVKMAGITEVAVIGAPDPKWGETVVAVCVTDGSTEITLDEVRDFAALTLARYKLPHHLVVVDALPKNGTGKLNKSEIRSIALEQTQETS